MSGKKTPISEIIKKKKEVKGADKYYQSEEELKKITSTDTQPQQDTTQDKQPKTDKDTDTAAVTDTQTDTDTVIEALIKPTDNYIRKVYYPYEYQNNFVIKKSKKYKVTESEIVRIALDYLMKSGKI